MTQTPSDWDEGALNSGTPSGLRLRTPYLETQKAIGKLTQGSDTPLWSGLTGAPFVTVSPVGTADGYPVNNGADFGPDTPGTTTCGINEGAAYAASAGLPLLMMGGAAYVVTGPVNFSYDGLTVYCGGGATHNFSGTNIPDPGDLTGLSGSVIRVNTSGIDGLQFDKMVTGFTLIGTLNIIFSSGLSSTGHGVNAQSTNDPNAVANHYATLISAHIDSIFVFGTDINHWAYYLQNIQESSIGNLWGQGLQGGLAHIGSDPSPAGDFSFGNSDIGQLSGRGGYGATYAGAITEFIGKDALSEINSLRIGRLEPQSASGCANYIKASHLANSQFTEIDCEGNVTAGDAISMVNVGGIFFHFDNLSPTVSGTGTDNFTVTNGTGNLFIGMFGGVTLNDTQTSDMFFDLSATPHALSAGMLAQIRSFLGDSYAVPNQLGTGSYSNATTSAEVVVGIGALKCDRYGRLLIEQDGDISNNTSTDGIQVYIYRSTVGIPATGAAPGSDDVNVFYSSYNTGIMKQRFSAKVLDHGLVVGIQYYYYLAIAAATGGTATFTNGTLGAKNPRL